MYLLHLQSRHINNLHCAKRLDFWLVPLCVINVNFSWMQEKIMTASRPEPTLSQLSADSWALLSNSSYTNSDSPDAAPIPVSALIRQSWSFFRGSGIYDQHQSCLAFLTSIFHHLVFCFWLRFFVIFHYFWRDSVTVRFERSVWGRAW